jgi:tetratricopeptide (TPR) repeat protein
MDEQETLGLIIDKIGSEQPDLAEAIRQCAIPHWFNKEILARLRGEEGKPSERTKTILDELKLKKVASVRRLDDQSYILHGNVRSLMLSRWRNQDAERFRESNEKTRAYYADMLSTERISDEQRAGWEREEMYHLLVADQERGIDRFISLANKAIDSFRLSTLNLLLGMAGEQTDDASSEIQLWIQFFEGKKEQVSSDWEKALAVWKGLKEERASLPVNLEKTLAVHLSILYKDMGEWNKAIECLDDSLIILDRKRDERGMITILNNRGYLYKDREHFQKAENDFQHALEVSKKIGDDRGMAVSLKNLGLLYKDNMKWDQALEHLGSSLAVLSESGISVVLPGLTTIGLSCIKIVDS